MPLWPVKVGVNGCVPSQRYTITLLFCDPTVLPSYFPLALLTFIAPQLNRMTRHSCIYWEFSCDFFFTHVLQVSGQQRKWKGYCLSGSPVRHPFQKHHYTIFYLQSTVASRSLPTELSLSLFSVFLDVWICTCSAYTSLCNKFVSALRFSLNFDLVCLWSGGDMNPTCLLHKHFSLLAFSNVWSELCDVFH